MGDKDIENLTNLELLYVFSNSKITNNAFKKLNKIKILTLCYTKVTLNVLQYLPN
jgi:hypothetical protein